MRNIFVGDTLTLDVFVTYTVLRLEAVYRYKADKQTQVQANIKSIFE